MNKRSKKLLDFETALLPGAPSTPDTEPICERCIWQLDWEGLLRTAPCSPQSWAGSVRAELEKGGRFPELSISAENFLPFPYCAVLMMVKDEADIIGINLDWLYHVGVRRFMLLDNNSADATGALIRKFQSEQTEAHVLVLHDPTVEHLQADKTNAMAQVAREIWPDLHWLLPVDADEFVIPRHGLQALAYVPDHVDALTIQKAVHFYPRGVSASDGVADLALMSTRCQIFSVPPKVILRASPDLGVTMGNHKAVHGAGKRVVYASGLPYGMFYREFQTRSFSQFLGKVRNGGAAILAARALGHDVGGEHWMHWYEILRQGGEPALRATYQDVAYRELGRGYIDDPFHEISALA